MNPKNLCSSDELNALVSVITPVYNGARFIQDTVESVAVQSVQVLEHIIIDDGSTDDTLAILDTLQARFPHVLVLKQENQGAGAARNKGIQQAKGKYIAFLDSDDTWLKDKLAAQIGFMETRHALFTYGDYDEIDEVSGEVLSRFETPKTLSYRDLLNGCPIGCLTVAYNQEALGKCYMPKVRRGQDWGLWLSITRNDVLAQKYPGNYARYTCLAASLSKNKFKKLLDVYAIYSQEQGFSAIRSIYHLIRHVLYARTKRKDVAS